VPKYIFDKKPRKSPVTKGLVRPRDGYCHRCGHKSPWIICDECIEEKTTGHLVIDADTETLIGFFREVWGEEAIAAQTMRFIDNDPTIAYTNDMRRGIDGGHRVIG
jgi:hypothetical protein